jgi:lipopolysaccharide/colanic/teichoic acid biosynthesis glycosyltransferase/glycosyltransferase involved in cell wall biosynthesis
MRGGERVVEALCEVFPRADLFTLTWDPERLSPALARRSVVTSPIHTWSRAPFVRGRFRALLPLFPLAVESFNLDRYSLVVSSSHCVAMGAVAPPRALHVAYMHSTLRYIREAQPAYEASLPGGPVGKTLFRGAAHYLRRWEVQASARPHVFIANSTYTRDRIRAYYRRDAQVIEPPIETERFELAARANRTPSDAPFLLVSALVPNKRVDLAMRAFQGRRERLVVVGDGPERARLERWVGENVSLLSRVSQAELESLYAGCRALLHTGVDDFGMVMAEALAAGKPVVASAEGGALDIVRDGETGIFIDAPTVEAVRAALDRFDAEAHRFDAETLQRSARRFDRTTFARRFAEAVEEAWERHEAKGNSRSAGGDRATNGVNGSGRMKATANGTNGMSHATNGSNATNGAHGARGSNATNGVHGTNGRGRAHGANGTHGANGGHAANGSNGATHGVHKTNGTHGGHHGSATGYLLEDPSAGHEPQRRAHTDPAMVAGWLARHPRAALTAKRVADVTLAAAGLALTGPLMMALGAIITLDSKGPALFFQRRTGLGQRPFTLIKLRTMHGDGNVTRVGRFLRPMGLDELPQLWNVLKGDMSLIGPRPEVPDRVERFEQHLPGFRARHLMRPGITGWAQVNGLRGNKSPIAERLRFDIEYLHDWSLPFDGRILTRTVSTVLGETIRSLRS